MDSYSMMTTISYQRDAPVVQQGQGEDMMAECVVEEGVSAHGEGGMDPVRLP